ncbi:MAG: SET domain-containing protein-lysine N-methyltransferase [Solirubrobacteraceae bacterium]
MHDEGCELRTAVDDRNDGVFATREFAAGDTVLAGVPGRPAPANHSHANQVSLTEWVFEDGLGPKVNHSCEPTCGVRENPAVGGFDFVALTPIGAGEEITFDYAMRNHVIEHFPTVCRCGMPRCRGAVTGWRDLPAERKHAYGALVAPYLREADRERASDPASSAG